MLVTGGGGGTRPPPECSASVQQGVGPFSPAHKPLGRQELAMRTGSPTGWHLPSHWEEDGGHRSENSH